MGNKSGNSRSSQLTGGEGFTYEDVVAAYFLAALLRGEAALGQPGYVTRVAVSKIDKASRWTMSLSTAPPWATAIV